MAVLISASRLRAATAAALTACPLLASAQGARPPAAAPQAAAPQAAAPPGRPAPLSDSLSDQAKVVYDSARLLYRDGDYSGALLQFERAYDLTSDARLMWNIAVCEKNLRRYARALKALGRYQTEGEALLTEQDRQDALFLSGAIKPFVSTLKISVNEPGARITIDDDPVGVTPLREAPLVDMGVRRVRVSKKGFYDFDERRQVIGQTDLSVDVKLVKEVHEGRVVVVAGRGHVIALDGRVVGQGRFAGTVASGIHALRVTAPGMQPYQSEIVVEDATVRRFQISLSPDPSLGLPTWLLIAGAVLVAGGIGAGAGYFGSRSDTPGPVEGTLQPYKIELR